MAAARKKAGKKEINLEDMVKSGDQATAYEALQLYRSRSNRAKQKGDIEQAIRVIVQGAKCLLLNGYDSAGGELTTLFMEMVEEHKRDIDSDARTMIIEIDDCFQPGSPSRVVFLKTCLKWSTIVGPRKLGEPMINTRLALSLWGSDQKRLSVYHFAAGEDPETLVDKVRSSNKNNKQKQKNVFSFE